MRRLFIFAFSIVLVPHHVKAQETRSSAGLGQVAEATATLQELIDLQLAVGEDDVDLKDQRARLLGFDKTGIRNRGGGVKAKNTPDGAGRSCLVALKGPKGLQPQSLILVWSKDYPEEERADQYGFRFSLDGRLEKAYSGTGKITKSGESVRGSAKDVSMKIKDLVVQQRARDELDFWLKRAGKYLAKKRAKAAAAGGGASVVQPAADLRAGRDAVADKPVEQTGSAGSAVPQADVKQ